MRKATGYCIVCCSITCVLVTIARVSKSVKISFIHQHFVVAAWSPKPQLHNSCFNCYFDVSPRECRGNICILYSSLRLYLHLVYLPFLMKTIKLRPITIVHSGDSYYKVNLFRFIDKTPNELVDITNELHDVFCSHLEYFCSKSCNLLVINLFLLQIGVWTLCRRGPPYTKLTRFPQIRGRIYCKKIVL